MARSFLHWDIAPQEIQLTENEVHLWSIALDAPFVEVYRLQRALSTDEVARASRLYFEKDRRRWIVARGILKTLLGYYSGMDPQQIQFCYNSYGKPALEGPFTPHGTLQFNLSHSSGLASYAFVLNRQVGIDVEYMRSNIEYIKLAKHYLSTYEYETLQSLPLEQQEQAFFRCWTQKEAYIKACGQGLSIPLDQFDVSLKPGDAAALLCSRADPSEVQRWTFHTLPNEEEAGYAGALVVEGANYTLRHW